MKKIIIGRVEHIDFPEQGLLKIPARIDTGARTSAIWASNIREHDGELSFTLFDKQSDYFTGAKLTTREYVLRNVASSNGHLQERYVVKLLVNIHGKKIRASFSLADRSTLVYPVLVGRRILSGRFIVDVKLGTPLIEQEEKRTMDLQHEGEETL